MAKNKPDGAPETCFAIMPIGDDGTDTRIRSDKVFTYIIAEAVGKAGYKALRGDHLHKGGRITNQIIELLVEVPLVIADLTGLNANVVYELAVRHAARKPVIHISEDSRDLPFDFYDMRTVKFNCADVESVHKAKESILHQAEAIRAGTPTDSPISDALDLKALKERGDPKEVSMAGIIAELAQIRSELRYVAGDTQGRAALAAADALAVGQRGSGSGSGLLSEQDLLSFFEHEELALPTPPGAPSEWEAHIPLSSAIEQAMLNCHPLDRDTLAAELPLAVGNIYHKRMLREHVARILSESMIGRLIFGRLDHPVIR